MVSLIVEGALLPGHGLDGAVHRGRFERGRPVRMEGVADGVDGGEGSLGGQGESVLVLRLEGDKREGRSDKEESSSAHGQQQRRDEIGDKDGEEEEQTPLEDPGILCPGLD